jgi:hypothetical protein
MPQRSRHSASSQTHTRLGRGLLLLDVRLADEIPSRLLRELDLEAVKVGGVLNATSANCDGEQKATRTGSSRNRRDDLGETTVSPTLRTCLAASFLAQPDCSHFSMTPAFSMAFLMGPEPAARGREARV